MSESQSQRRSWTAEIRGGSEDLALDAQCTGGIYVSGHVVEEGACFRRATHAAEGRAEDLRVGLGPAEFRRTAPER